MGWENSRKKLVKFYYGVKIIALYYQGGKIKNFLYNFELKYLKFFKLFKI
jgi:hypothetical protein